MWLVTVIILYVALYYILVMLITINFVVVIIGLIQYMFSFGRIFIVGLIINLQYTLNVFVKFFDLIQCVFQVRK